MTGAGSTSNVAKAISRSRRARAAQRARRRRFAALIVFLAASLGGAGIWSIGAANGTDMVEAAVTQAKSLADLIGQRSPGERTEAQLTKSRAHSLTRHQHAAAPQASIRHAQAVPKVNIKADIAKLLAAAPLPTMGGAQPVSFPPLALEAPPSIGAIVGPPSGGTPPGASPPGGGSPPAGFPTPQPKSPITVPSAVPEPGTWATMLLGFALVGWRVRRKRPAEPLPA